MHSSGIWQAALLRGVNVGGKQTVPMAALREAVTDCGYADARTYLNSGNVIFRSHDAPSEAAARLRTAIAARTGVDTPVLVRTHAQLDAVIAGNPWKAEAAAAPSRCLVLFMSEQFGARERALVQGTPWDRERVAYAPHAIYALLPDGISASAPFERLSRQLRDTVTARNWRTVCALHAQMAPPA